MKSTTLVFLFLFSFLGQNMRSAFAQESLPNPLSEFILGMFRMHQGKTLCADGSTMFSSIRSNVANYLKVNDLLAKATPPVVATAVWTLYPCPFSPSRSELRPAGANDIEGVWLFPESSQKLRFGPNSPQKSPAGPLPVKCDAVGYYSNGELRHAVIAGQAKCPFEKAADLDIARKNPRVSDWALLRDGRIGVNRTDVANHIEEWDVYAVVTPFAVNDVQFLAGDLIAYARKENGNKFGAATQFRHLQRLP